jgi:hypothetical protein
MIRLICLEQIEIEQNCPASWNRMEGNDVARFCDHCEKHVYDLSAMTRTDAERLVCEKAGNLCAQFRRDPTGEVMTLDYHSAPEHRGWSGRGKLLLGLAFALVSGVVTATLYGSRVFPISTARGGVSVRCMPGLRPSGSPTTPSSTEEEPPQGEDAKPIEP